MEQRQFLLDMIQVCIEHKVLQLTAALRQAKWAETLSAASFSGALPSDWFGRQLVQVTPELFLTRPFSKQSVPKLCFCFLGGAVIAEQHRDAVALPHWPSHRTFARQEPHKHKYLLAVSINGSRSRQARRTRSECCRPA